MDKLTEAFCRLNPALPDDKEETSKIVKGLASGSVSGTNEDRQNILKSVYYSDLREKEMLMLFGSLSEHEQERIIGRAEPLLEQDKLEESADKIYYPN